MLYAVIVNDNQDYSMSWTGNYAGFSCTIKGLYTTLEQAFEHTNYPDYEIKEIPLNQEIDILLGGCMEYHEDDY